MDNGHTVSYMQALAGGTLTSGNVKLDMGDMGTISMASHSAAGISTIADMTPNGGEEAWDDLGTDIHGRPQDGVAQPHSGNRIGYNTTAGGVTVTAAANYEFAAPTTSIAVQMPNLVEGLNIGAGGEHPSSRPGNSLESGSHPDFEVPSVFDPIEDIPPLPGAPSASRPTRRPETFLPRGSGHGPPRLVCPWLRLPFLPSS
jgi:hypothetical protein